MLLKHDRNFRILVYEDSKYGAQDLNFSNLLTHQLVHAYGDFYPLDTQVIFLLFTNQKVQLISPQIFYGGKEGDIFRCFVKYPRFYGRTQEITPSGSFA